MFEPVSQLPYVLLSHDKQALVVAPCSHADVGRWLSVLERWRPRAYAAIPVAFFGYDLVRDLLANPQVRAVVFDSVCDACAAPWRSWFEGVDAPALDRIDAEHRSLIRQYVDLFDDEYEAKGPLQPWWPSRIRYLE